MNLLINSTNVRNTEELVRGSLESIEGAFFVMEDKKITFSDAAIIFNIATPIQAAIEEIGAVKTELATCTNEEFERAFDAGASGFNLPGKPELTADIRGLVKGIFHATRMIVRGSVKEDEPLPA